MTALINKQDLMDSIENLHRILAAPITEAEKRDGWTEKGKLHWCLIVDKWRSSIHTERKAAAVPINSKHLDQSGGANSGGLFNMLDSVSDQIERHQRQYSLFRKLSWITVEEVIVTIIFLSIIAGCVIGLVTSLK